MWIDERTVTEHLDTDRALELLSAAPLGRLAMSRRALPWVVPVRHVVTDGRVLVRTHRPWNHHTSCDGTVVAYAADSLREPESWHVQVVGAAKAIEPSPRERELFLGAPATVDDEPYDPVFLSIEPQIVNGRIVRTAPPA
jgi:nitroimidazol reductase NimA-like FMN-containing flavoprotein (pyridoxamine 5'-phosphate oxidase superfamily)